MSAHYESAHGFDPIQADFVCSTYQQAGQFVGVVYVYTNTLNGKKYVGQTLSPKPRWNSHFAAAKNNYRDSDSAFHRAIRKYSEWGWTYDILEFIYADTRQEYQELVDERERYWISQLDTCNSAKGYNATAGGQGKSYRSAKRQSKAVDQYTLWGEYVRSFDDQKSAAASLGMRNITKAFTEPDHHHQAGGFLWVRKGEKPLQEDIDYYKSMLIYQYDMDGNYLNTFFKMKAIHAYLTQECNIKVSYPIVNGTIRKAMKLPQTRSAYGFKWYKEKYDKLPFTVNEGWRIPVLEYDLQGNLVKKHRSITDCTKEHNIDFSALKRHCGEDNPKPIKGRIFRFKNAE